MPLYLVSWCLHIDAETPEAAALEARAMQTDPASVATWFEVLDEYAAAAIGDATAVACSEARLRGGLHMIDTERLPKEPL